MMSKRFLSFAAALLAVMCLGSCTNEKTENIQQKTDNVEVNETADAVDIVTDEVQEELPEEAEQNEIASEQEPEQERIVYINPLTGLETEKDLSTKRPITVMVNNLYEALPQIGISEADIIYETLEEGGITRLLCVYNDYSNIPEIGSVRSARDYYIDIADAHDAIFVHAGGSTYAYTALSERRTNNIDGIYHNQFYRSAERRKTMSKEHTLMISGNGIDDAIAYRGYRTTTSSPSPLVFSTEYTKGSLSANHIEFAFSIGKTSRPYIKAFFDYNAETGEYLKGQFGQAHIDGDDNSQLSFKNILTLTCPMNAIKGDALGCIQVHFTGTGRGTYSVDGTQREIVWKKQSRTSSYTLYESDGETPLMLSPGKSYIAIVPTGTEITLN